MVETIVVGTHDESADTGEGTVADLVDIEYAV